MFRIKHTASGKYFKNVSYSRGLYGLLIFCDSDSNIKYWKTEQSALKSIKEHLRCQNRVFQYVPGSPSSPTNERDPFELSEFELEKHELVFKSSEKLA